MFSRRHHRVFVLGLLSGTIFISLLSPVSVQAASAMPPGAFLRHPAATSAALRRELYTDPRVISRYSRLMHLSPEMVQATFATLRLTPLKQDRVMEVHYVHFGERIGAKARRLRKGTPVFALPDGTPVLAQTSGNPLRAIRGVHKQLTQRPVAVPGVFKVAQMAVLSDVPDFDPNEPLSAPVGSVSSFPQSLREEVPVMPDAVPLVETLPKEVAATQDTFGPDEMPADPIPAGGSPPATVFTLVQGLPKLTKWLGGAALVGALAGLTSNGNEVIHVAAASSPLKSGRPLPFCPVSPAPVNALAQASPEPGFPLLSASLTTAFLTMLYGRRRKQRR